MTCQMAVTYSRIRESRVRTHKESDDMPTGTLLVEQKSFEKETWPLNLDLKKAKHNSLSVVPPLLFPHF
jgi:hypothetical protein